MKILLVKLALVIATFGCANPPCLMVDGGKMIKKDNPFNLLNNEEKHMIDINTNHVTNYFFSNSCIMPNDYLLVNFNLPYRIANRYQMYKLLKNNPSYLTSGTPDDSIYVSYVDSLDNTNIGKIYRFSKQLELGDTIASYTEILSVNPIFTAESNHKIVNEIYWRTWVHDVFEFSPADSAYLLSVAEQHPHQGGTAVYDARVMLGLDFFDYDDGDEQKSASYYEDENSIIDELGEIKFVLYPNPANSLINYRTTLLDNEFASLILYDVLGRPIFNKNLGKDNKDGIIDINEFDPGLYTFEVIINHEIKISGTFIIN